MPWEDSPASASAPLPPGNLDIMYVQYCCACNTFYDVSTPDSFVQSELHRACRQRLLQRRLALARWLDCQFD